jgi:hypothetical protein
MIIIKSNRSNDFLDDWLAWVVGLAFDANQSELWKDGSNTANETETPTLMLQALRAEVERGNIVVENIEDEACNQETIA